MAHVWSVVGDVRIPRDRCSTDLKIADQCGVVYLCGLCGELVSSCMMELMSSMGATDQLEWGLM